jgi:hypothetical protein
MSYHEWIQGPFGLDAAKGATVPGHRKVLVVVHHFTAGTRLADVLPLLESDRRVHVAYTAAPASIFRGGAAEYVRGLGGLVLPWEQATQLGFDLAIAASDGMLEDIHAPVLTLQHGAGPGKLYGRVQGLGPAATRPITGLLRERVVVGGRVIPSAIILGHERHRLMLERDCPEALPVAIMGGDPCFDRLMASVRLRGAYRRALGVEPAQQLIFVSSTWNKGSLFGQHPDFLFRVAAELPRKRYRVVAALHPHIWSWYGRRQITAWQTDCLRLGVRLLPPEEGWRAALLAADRIIGDHGSVTYYGAAMGVPVVLAAFPEDDVAPGSHIARLGAIAPRLDWNKPLQPQVDAADQAYSADTYDILRDELSSKPGESAGILRRAMYRLMRLQEPPNPPRVEPVPMPCPIRHGAERAA